MNKKAKSKLSFGMDVAGILVMLGAITLVKVSNQPLTEIMAGIIATIGFGLIAGAKYV